MMKTVWFFGFALLFVSSVGFAGADKKAPDQKPAPQMAGMGFASFPVAPKHECATAMSQCMSGCKSISGSDCQQECQTDCEVCALDVGEDVEKICLK